MFAWYTCILNVVQNYEKKYYYARGFVGKFEKWGVKGRYFNSFVIGSEQKLRVVFVAIRVMP